MTTNQSSIDKINQAAKRASGLIESRFLFLVQDTAPFDFPLPDWLEELANELTEGFFWQMQNGDVTKINDAKEHMTQTIQDRFERFPTITRGNNLI